MQLRPYQVEAIQAIYHHLRTHRGNPLAVIPTGGGKTPVIAQICRDAVETWNGRVLLLAHVKELLEQAAEKLMTMAPGLPMGIYSAGLGRKDLGYSVTVAGIQSIYTKACDVGPVNLILVDECHLIPAEDDGMYRQFIADAQVVNPDVRVVGLTATPYRLKSGSIAGKENVLNEVCYEIGVRELIVQGYLSPLRTKAGVQKVDMSGLHIRAGEFISSEVETLMGNADVVAGAVSEILEYTQDRKATLIFTAGTQHGQRVVDQFAAAGIECGFVTGKTPAGQRDAILNRFRRGDLRYLANVNVLTTGFDAPHIDCVALMRPTMSPGLYYQMVGRGFRLAEGKADCLVLDFGGNVLRHGPVDAIQIKDKAKGTGGAAKECPECSELISAGYGRCPACDYEFPPPVRGEGGPTHDAQATSAGIITGQVTREVCRVSEQPRFSLHTKRDAPDKPPTMRVQYRIGFNRYVSEWVCFEHGGFARAKAEQWWRRHAHDPVPNFVEEALELIRAGAIAETRAVTIEHKAGEKYGNVVDWEVGEKPQRPDVEAIAAAMPAVQVPDVWEDIDETDLPF